MRLYTGMYIANRAKSVKATYETDFLVVQLYGSYTPENCRWADHVTQCNNRSTNIHIKIGNSLRTLTEWCKIFELDYNRINARYNRNPNISIEELFNK